MRLPLLAVFLWLGAKAVCQPPILYVHIVSHNEPGDNLQTALNYERAKNRILQLAEIINAKNARWNIQTSDGFVLGALNDQANTANNVFNILANPPYSDNIEIDPRSKNSNGRNIADQWYLLDSLGANPTTHLGGCIYSTTNPSVQPIDWEQYRNPIIGNIFGNSWQCSIITGAGSYPPHTNDLNDFGIFKPDTATNFYQHNPSKNLWCLGTGCAPLLDSMDNEQAIIDLIQGQIDSIQTGLWPADKFYVTRIMTNQREYGPLFFQKIARVIDSLNTIPSSQMRWATISETFSAFQEWQVNSGLDYSQWQCGQFVTSVAEIANDDFFSIYPNPSAGNYSIDFIDDLDHQIQVFDLMGKSIFFTTSNKNTEINLSSFSNGFYVVKIDGVFLRKIIKQ
ncbi:MAG: T9SS type A sorting domain-containing protein [Saprospiraceae bacterium]|nr:T9SS type A sorting domain-containing protein [Saprospiraceae bacterium]